MTELLFNIRKPRSTLQDIVRKERQGKGTLIAGYVKFYKVIYKTKALYNHFQTIAYDSFRFLRVLVQSNMYSVLSSLVSSLLSSIMLVKHSTRISFKKPPSIASRCCPVVASHKVFLYCPRHILHVVLFVVHTSMTLKYQQRRTGTDPGRTNFFRSYPELNNP